MKYSTSVKAFRAAFSTVGRVIPKKSPKPILTNARLRVTSAGAELSATDLERGIRHPIAGGEVIEPGGCLLPGEVIDKILASADESTLTIEFAGGCLKVECGRAKWRPQTPTEDEVLFPEVPLIDGQPQFSVATSDLVSMIDRTKHAVDLDTTSFALGGMLVETDGAHVRFVATDGRRMAVQECPADVNMQVPKNSVLPAKFADLIVAVAKDVDETASFVFDQFSATVQIGGSTLWGRLVEGRFPAWREIFKAVEEDVRIDEMDPKSFGSALTQASATSNETTTGVEFRFTDALLTLASTAGELGSSEVSYPVGYSGNDFIGLYKPFHLVSALKSIGADRFSLSTGPKGLAILIRTDSGYSFVSMGLTRAKA